MEGYGDSFFFYTHEELLVCVFLMERLSNVHLFHELGVYGSMFIDRMISLSVLGPLMKT